MKEWLKSNWFKVVLLVLAFVWIFFSIIFPRYAGTRCQKWAAEQVKTEKVSSIAGYDLAYRICMDKWGY